MMRNSESTSSLTCCELLRKLVQLNWRRLTLFVRNSSDDKSIRLKSRRTWCDFVSCLASTGTQCCFIHCRLPLMWRHGSVTLSAQLRRPPRRLAAAEAQRMIVRRLRPTRPRLLLCPAGAAWQDRWSRFMQLEPVPVVISDRFEFETERTRCRRQEFSCRRAEINVAYIAEINRAEMPSFQGQITVKVISTAHRS